jgi:hypothetical protein
LIVASKSAMPPKLTGLGLHARLMPRTTSAAVTARAGFVFHITPLRRVTACFRPLSLTTGKAVARSGAATVL